MAPITANGSPPTCLDYTLDVGDSEAQVQSNGSDQRKPVPLRPVVFQSGSSIVYWILGQYEINCAPKSFCKIRKNGAGIQ
jgi:hypothetical protein